MLFKQVTDRAIGVVHAMASPYLDCAVMELIQLERVSGHYGMGAQN
jgi:hypothetical protein